MRLFKVTGSTFVKCAHKVEYIVASTLAEAAVNCCGLFPFDVLSIEELASEVTILE